MISRCDCYIFALHFIVLKFRLSDKKYVLTFLFIGYNSLSFSRPSKICPTTLLTCWAGCAIEWTLHTAIHWEDARRNSINTHFWLAIVATSICNYQFHYNLNFVCARFCHAALHCYTDIRNNESLITCLEYFDSKKKMLFHSDKIVIE